MVDAGLLRPVGQTRGRYYLAEPKVTAEREALQETRALKETSDPFELASGQPALS
jgi:hypothetical protein